MFSIMNTAQAIKWKKEKKPIMPVHKSLIVGTDGKVIVPEEPADESVEADKKSKKKKKKKKEAPPIEELIPEGDYRFVKYNELPGEVELDLTNLKRENQLNTSHCISPDFTKMAYTQVYFYPGINRVTSELYYIEIDKEKPPMQSVKEASIKDKEQIPLLSYGIGSAQTQEFRTVVCVDWSYDSTKLLIKSRRGETQRELWECGIWVYDFEERQIYKLSNLRRDIRDDYLRRFKVNLSSYQWDIQPIGWDLNNTDRVIVYAYGLMPDKHRAFLGAWNVGFRHGDIQFLSKTRNDFEVAQYGYKIKRFD